MSETKFKCIKCNEVIEGEAFFTPSGRGPWCEDCSEVRTSKLFKTFGDASIEVFEELGKINENGAHAKEVE